MYVHGVLTWLSPSGFPACLPFSTRRQDNWNAAKGELDLVVMEGRDRIGGRIHTVQNAAGWPSAPLGGEADMGARQVCLLTYLATTMTDSNSCRKSPRDRPPTDELLHRSISAVGLCRLRLHCLIIRLWPPLTLRIHTSK